MQLGHVAPCCDASLADSRMIPGYHDLLKQALAGGLVPVDKRTEEEGAPEPRGLGPG